MANLLITGIVSLLALTFVASIWRSKSTTRELRGSLFRNIGMPDRNFIALVLGATASLLPLTTGTWTIWLAAWIFVVALGITILLLVAVRPPVDGFAWGLPVIVALGFGLGALNYQARSWWIWLWNQLMRIDLPHERALLALFLIGAMLGVFVVRNWAKDQKGFTESLSGVLGGTFVAAVFVKMFEDVPQMSQKAFSLYALGFALSGAINLFAASRLIAHYTNKRSIVSRAILDFMYGSERADTIDKYFLKNFEEDPDYAKRSLINTLLEFRTITKRLFAARMEATRERRLREDPNWYYYELIAIEEKTHHDATEQPDGPPKERIYDIFYRPLINQSEPESPLPAIQEEMVRVGVSITNADQLEYIVAPGEYHAPFPRLKSVAGLALEMRQSIVMDRDQDRKFRNKDHRDGISPGEVEQSRGLDEIDFLAYILIPVVSRLGESTENALGLVHIDTKLFISRPELDGKPSDRGDDVLMIEMKRKQLTDMAALLYDDDDKDIMYLENLAKMIRPLLELYVRCRVGAP